MNKKTPPVVHSVPSLKLLLPPEELELVQKKKQLELERLRIRLKTLELQQKILENRLKTIQTLTEMKLEILTKLKQIYQEKVKELAIAGLKLYGVVGKVGITPNLAVKSGEKIGKDLKLEINPSGIFLKDTKTGEELIVPIYTESPNALVRVISTQISQGKNFEQTFQLQSGEVFQLNPNNQGNILIKSH